MSKEIVNQLTQKYYINSKKLAEIATKANGPHKVVLEKKAKMLMNRSNRVAAMV